MKIEDRLSDAMHDYADGIEPSEDSWVRISARFDDGGAPPRRSMPGRLVFAGVAITLVVVLIAVLAIRDDGATNKVVTNPTTPGAPLARPTGVVASTTDRTVVSLGSATGQRHETLTTIPRLTSIAAIQPGGLDAVYGTGAGAGGCADPQAEVGTLDLASGSRTRIVSGGLSPAVSPDGRFVAYGIVCDGVTLGYSDLRDGKNYRIDPFPRSANVGRMTSVEPVVWSGDSKRLLYRVVFEGDATPKLFLGRLWPQADDTNAVELTGRTVTAAAFVDDQIAATADDVDAGSTVTLTSLHVPCSAPCALQLDTSASPAFEVPGRVTSLVGAPGGHLLVVTEDHVLYRWSMGDKAPTKLAEGITAASWIHDTSNEPRHETLPNGVLIAKRDGELVVVGAQDGGQHSSLGTFPGISDVATTTDGRKVLIATPRKSATCGEAPQFDVTKLVPATGETTSVGGGAGALAVSPDDKYLVFGVSCAGPSLGFTSLETGAASGADALGSVVTERSPGIRVVDPLGWSPDSKRLVYRVHLAADDEPHYYVGRLWPVVPQAQTQVVELPRDSGNANLLPIQSSRRQLADRLSSLPLDSPDRTALEAQLEALNEAEVSLRTRVNGRGISAATFIDNDTIALAEPLGATTEIRRWTISTGSREIASPLLVKVPGRVTALIAAPGGHLLAVTEGNELYRWSVGDAAPTKLADGVVAASWIPWS